jgi:hypothetical protein
MRNNWRPTTITFMDDLDHFLFHVQWALSGMNKNKSHDNKRKSMGKIILSIVLVLVIIYIVPFLVYSLFAVTTDLKPPASVSPLQFLVSVFVSKIGVAIAFVLIFYFGRSALGGQWVLYAFAWWLMLVIGEIGQAIGPDYTWKEAVAGFISETIYFPLSAYIVNWLLVSR